MLKNIYKYLSYHNINLKSDIKLSEDLIFFYNSYSNYDSFISPRDHSHLYNHVVESDVKNILEVGAGVSNAFRYFQEKNINYHAQDISNQNSKFYDDHKINFLLGDLGMIKSNYNVIFSSYVLEHVTDPQKFLIDQLNLLSINGYILIECPNYYLPFHVPPSLRHYSIFKQFYLTLLLYFENIFGRQNEFLINNKPAFKFIKWKRDYDAINIVSYRRLKRFCLNNDLKLSRNLVPLFSKKRMASMIVKISRNVDRYPTTEPPLMRFRRS